jgi:transcriptional regulator EpsA
MANTSLVTPSLPPGAMPPAHDAAAQRKISGPATGITSSLATAGTPPRAATQPTDSERFMQIVQAAGTVSSHYDLFLFLQSKVQYFIPHQVMLAAWGDFRCGEPKFDVVSALPGVRTEALADCGIEHLLKNCFNRYVAGGRKPLRLDAQQIALEKLISCNCALHESIRGMRSITVFGVRNERDNQDSLYIAMHPVCTKRAQHTQHQEYFAFLINAVLAQIDVAFRKVAALKRPCTTAAAVADERPALTLEQFSERELSVLQWLVHGKSNPEIAEKLNISAFTVKNHAQRIYKKLAVCNRTEAAEKYRLLFA